MLDDPIEVFLLLFWNKTTAELTMNETIHPEI